MKCNYTYTAFPSKSLDEAVFQQKVLLNKTLASHVGTICNC